MNARHHRLAGRNARLCKVLKLVRIVAPRPSRSGSMLRDMGLVHVGWPHVERATLGMLVFEHLICQRTEI